MRAVILDTETTGKTEPQLIEAAWLECSSVDEFNQGRMFEQRYRPTKPIELGALATHHILDEDLVGCAPASDFVLPPDVEYIIGHNIDYDWRVIGEPNVKRICTLAMSRALWPLLDSHSLSAMVYCLDRHNAKERLQRAHSALADCLSCKLVLEHVAVDAENWEDLWERSERARVPKVMPFGKHRGLPMKDVPRSYKDWLLNQPDTDPYLVLALQK